MSGHDVFMPTVIYHWGKYMRPDRASNIETWEINALTLILLRQFKRLFADKGINLTDGEMQLIADAVDSRNVLPQTAKPLISALDTLITESMAVLGGWDLSFEESLATDMTDLNHLWDSTADFLMLANEKGNAEIRISAGSALQTLLGDKTHVGELITAIHHDLRVNGTLDVDAMICKRAVLHIAQIPHDDPAWQSKMSAWVEQQKH
jgi:hypothetical protein